MKITSKLIIILLCVLLVGAVVWAFCERKARDHQETKAEAKEKEKLADPTAPLAAQHTDALGQKHSSFETTGNAISQNTVAVSKSVLDTISKLSGVNKKDIVNWQEIAMTSQAKELKARQIIDSLKGVALYYKGKYIELTYRPATNPEDPDDKGVFDYKYNAKLNTVGTNKGLRFLGVPIGSQRTFTDVFSDDVNATIDGLRTLQIKPKENAFNVNGYLFANYLFDEANVQTGAGLKVQITDRLSIKGGYYYNTNDFQVKKPKPFAGAELNFFK